MRKHHFRIKTVWGKGYLFCRRRLELNMRRLFLRFLFVYLIGITGDWLVGRNGLWEQSQSPDLPGWVELLGQSLAYQLTTPDLSAEQVAAQLNLPLQTLPAQSIAWSEAEQQALERGQLVPLFSDNQVYFLSNATKSTAAVWSGAGGSSGTQHLPLYPVIFFCCWVWRWPAGSGRWPAILNDCNASYTNLVRACSCRTHHCRTVHYWRLLPVVCGKWPAKSSG